MKLDLKALRGNPGHTHPIAGKLALNADDFHEPITVRTVLAVEGAAQFFRGEVIVLNVTLQVELDRECSRCLRPVLYQIDISETVTLRGTQEEEILPEDYGYLIESKTIDLKPIFLSLVLDEFDPKPLCRADCKGLCPNCGADLNEQRCDCHAEHTKDPRLAGLAKLLDN